MRRAVIGTLFLLVWSLVAPYALGAAVIPDPPRDFYCLDQANILAGSTEKAIINSGRELAKSTGAQIVVVTINSLGDAALEEYANELFRKWGIGDKEKNNGVLLLVAIKERKSRIEVGYGLEGILPDGKTGRIQDQYLLPFFKQGEYDQGIINTYNAILREVGREYGQEFKAIAPAGNTPESKTGRDISWGEVILILLVLCIIFFGRRLFRRRRRLRRWRKFRRRRFQRRRRQQPGMVANKREPATRLPALMNNPGGGVW